jgi:hypothetical protein
MQQHRYFLHRLAPLLSAHNNAALVYPHRVGEGREEEVDGLAWRHF